MKTATGCLMCDAAIVEAFYFVLFSLFSQTDSMTVSWQPAHVLSLPLGRCLLLNNRTVCLIVGKKLFVCGWIESIIYFKSAFFSPDQIIISFILTFTECLSDTSPGSQVEGGHAFICPKPSLQIRRDRDSRIIWNKGKQQKQKCI